MLSQLLDLENHQDIDQMLDESARLAYNLYRRLRNRGHELTLKHYLLRNLGTPGQEEFFRHRDSIKNQVDINNK